MLELPRKRYIALACTLALIYCYPVLIRVRSFTMLLGLQLYARPGKLDYRQVVMNVTCGRKPIFHITTPTLLRGLCQLQTVLKVPSWSRGDQKTSLPPPVPGDESLSSTSDSHVMNYEVVHQKVCGRTINCISALRTIYRWLLDLYSLLA